MNATINRFGMAAAVFGILMGFQNCSKVKVGFEADPASNGVKTNGDPNPNTCNEEELQTITTPIRLLMIVDMSGSNAPDPMSNLPGTDPGKTMRLGSIQQFYADYGAKTNFDWGLIGFQNTSAFAFINSGSQASPAFSNSSSVVTAAINEFGAKQDKEATPYEKAITMARSLISGDTAASNDTKYIVVFLSDGMPTDYEKDRFNVLTANGRNNLLSDITSLVNLKPNRVSFSTVYYGENNVNAASIMQDMASTGGGQFLDVNANPAVKDFLINSVVTVPGGHCPVP